MSLLFVGDLGGLLQDQPRAGVSAREVAQELLRLGLVSYDDLFIEIDNGGGNFRYSPAGKLRHVDTSRKARIIPRHLRIPQKQNGQSSRGVQPRARYGAGSSRRSLAGEAGTPLVKAGETRELD